MLVPIAHIDARSIIIDRPIGDARRIRADSPVADIIDFLRTAAHGYREGEPAPILVSSTEIEGFHVRIVILLSIEEICERFMVSRGDAIAAYFDAGNLRRPLAKTTIQIPLMVRRMIGQWLNDNAFTANAAMIGPHTPSFEAFVATRQESDDLFAIVADPAILAPADPDGGAFPGLLYGGFYYIERCSADAPHEFMLTLGTAQYSSNHLGAMERLLYAFALPELEASLDRRVHHHPGARGPTLH